VVRVLVSLTERDHVEESDRGLERFACVLREAGFRVCSRAATDDDVTQLGSSWAKRLGIPRRRPANVLVGECAEDLLHLAERKDQQEEDQRDAAGNHHA
jgi:hypothetical protein